MCIIAYIPKGVQIKEDTIKTMFENNPHGAGIMWKPNDKGLVEIRKGFMKVEDLLKAYKEIPVDCEKAIHCRIATSGKVSVACCHPFPVRKKAAEMTRATDKCDIAIMHNGIIDFCTPSKGMESRFSDSMIFAADILPNFIHKLDMSTVQGAIESCISPSRMLLFRSKGDVMLFGHWEVEDEIWYSNLTFRKSSWGYPYGGRWNGRSSFNLDECGSRFQGGFTDGKFRFSGKKSEKKADKAEATEVTESPATLALDKIDGDIGIDGDFESDDEMVEEVKFEVDASAYKDLSDEAIEMVAEDITYEIEDELSKMNVYVTGEDYDDSEVKTIGIIKIILHTVGLPRSLKAVCGHDIVERCEIDMVDDIWE